MSQRLDRYDQKGYAAKQLKLLENLNIAKKMLILAKRIKKNQLLGNLIRNQFKISLILTKKLTFTIRNKRKLIKTCVIG